MFFGDIVNVLRRYQECSSALSGMFFGAIVNFTRIYFPELWWISPGSIFRSYREFHLDLTSGELTFHPDLDLRWINGSLGFRRPVKYHSTRISTSGELTVHSDFDVRWIIVSPGSRPPVNYRSTRNPTSGEFLFHQELDIRRITFQPENLTSCKIKT